MQGIHGGERENRKSKQKKRKTHLTHTGLLMEGLEDYFRVARDPAGIAVTPETDTRKSIKRGLGAITHETLQRYRWPIRGASLQVLP